MEKKKKLNLDLITLKNLIQEFKQNNKPIPSEFNEIIERTSNLEENEIQNQVIAAKTHNNKLAGLIHVSILYTVSELVCGSPIRGPLIS